MLLISFFQWWYSHGWMKQLDKVAYRASGISKSFSFLIILRTMFAPWKQIISSPGQGSTIGDKMRALLDNLVSRVVGFFVRFFVLLAGVIMLLVVVAASGAMVIIWPLLPISPVILVILTLGGV